MICFYFCMWHYIPNIHITLFELVLIASSGSLTVIHWKGPNPLLGPSLLRVGLGVELFLKYSSGTTEKGLTPHGPQGRHLITGSKSPYKTVILVYLHAIYVHKIWVCVVWADCYVFWVSVELFLKDSPGTIEEGPTPYGSLDRHTTPKKKAPCKAVILLVLPATYVYKIWI